MPAPDLREALEGLVGAVEHPRCICGAEDQPWDSPECLESQRVDLDAALAQAQAALAQEKCVPGRHVWDKTAPGDLCKCALVAYGESPWTPVVAPPDRAALRERAITAAYSVTWRVLSRHEVGVMVDAILDLLPPARDPERTIAALERAGLLPGPAPHLEAPRDG